MSAPGGDAVADAIAQMDRITADLDRQAADLGRDLRALREKFARDDAERAEAARSGDLGREWQKLQRRIDLDETSVGALISGADQSSEAAALRGEAGRNLRALYAEQAATVEEEGDPVIGETVALQAEIRAMVAEIRTLPAPPAS